MGHRERGSEDAKMRRCEDELIKQIVKVFAHNGMGEEKWANSQKPIAKG
jgi:hypothetical protein